MTIKGPLMMQQVQYVWRILPCLVNENNKRLADQLYKNHLRGFSADELKHINLSREAYLADEHLYGMARKRATLEMNDEIITFSIG